MSKQFRVAAALIFCVPAIGLTQQVPTRTGDVPPPATGSSSSSGAADGLITLDLVVTDQSGRSVADLGSRDFTLLDHGQPENVLSFQAFDGPTAKPDPPVEVILLIDTVNMRPQQISAAMSEAEKFLRGSNGHLAQPVSIYLLSNTGPSSMPQLSTDGNAMADAIAHGHDLPVVRQTPRFGVGQTYVENGQIFRMTAGGVANRNSLRALASIAPVLLGLALGYVASLTIGKSLAALLYGTSPTDLSVIVPVVCIFVVAAVAATFVPCRRAAKIEPMEALRTE